MSTNRETARDALSTLLQTALVGTGLPAGAVYAYQVGKFDATPAVVVYSAGSDRSDLTSAGGQATFRFIIDVFVAYTDDGSWNEDDAEDRVDLLEKAIWDTLQANQVTANWQSVDYTEPTKVETIIVDGQGYRTERIPVSVTVFN
jgi:hypothetical protein